MVFFEGVLRFGKRQFDITYLPHSWFSRHPPRSIRTLLLLQVALELFVNVPTRLTASFCCYFIIGCSMVRPPSMTKRHVTFDVHRQLILLAVGDDLFVKRVVCLWYCCCSTADAPASLLIVILCHFLHLSSCLKRRTWWKNYRLFAAPSAAVSYLACLEVPVTIWRMH